MNEPLYQAIEQAWITKYDWKPSEAVITELFDIAHGETDEMKTKNILRVIKKTNNHYKVKEFVEANAKQASEKKQRQAKKSTALTEQLKWMYEPFLDDKTIDIDQYNAIIAQRQDMPFSLHDYQQGLFNVQKAMYKHPRQWIQGLGLNQWETQAFGELVLEQQENFNLELIREAGIQYKQEYQPDPEMTTTTISQMFGLNNVEVPF